AGFKLTVGVLVAGEDAAAKADRTAVGRAQAVVIIVDDCDVGQPQFIHLVGENATTVAGDGDVADGVLGTAVVVDVDHLTLTGVAGDVVPQAAPEQVQPSAGQDAGGVGGRAVVVQVELHRVQRLRLAVYRATAQRRRVRCDFQSVEVDVAPAHRTQRTAVAAAFAAAHDQVVEPGVVAGRQGDVEKAVAHVADDSGDRPAMFKIAFDAQLLGDVEVAPQRAADATAGQGQRVVVVGIRMELDDVRAGLGVGLHHRRAQRALLAGAAELRIADVVAGTGVRQILGVPVH